jgi:hypothetical protein
MMLCRKEVRVNSLSDELPPTLLFPRPCHNGKASIFSGDFRRIAAQQVAGLYFCLPQALCSNRGKEIKLIT